MENIQELKNEELIEQEITQESTQEITSESANENAPETPPVNPLRVLYEKEKKKRGPVKGMYIRAPWRHTGETYINTPTDPEYYKKYYHRMVKGHFHCEKCGCEFTSKKAMVFHQIHSPKCPKLQALLAQLD